MASRRLACPNLNRAEECDDVSHGLIEVLVQEEVARIRIELELGSGNQTCDAGGWTDYLSGDAGLDSGIDQVARRFRRGVGGGSADPERAQSVIVAPHDPQGRIGALGQLEPPPQEGRYR